MNNTFFRIAGACLLLVLSSPAFSRGCQPTPGQYYEEIYCKLHARGKTVGLPNIFEFRQNDPETQAALLKRPAEKAGIKLKPPVVKQSKETVVTKKPAVSKPVTPEKSSVQVAYSNPQDCAVSDTSLTCNNIRYSLVTNKKNTSINLVNLTDSHKLRLPSPPAGFKTETERNNYLADAYNRYISGMIEIGLGGSTMTYTSFVYFYETLQEKKIDFSGRFEKMYQHLKQDKLALQVDTNQTVPENFSTRYCSSVSNSLLSCEFDKTNYVFARR
jgi:hypothetical protein